MAPKLIGGGVVILAAVGVWQLAAQERKSAPVIPVTPEATVDDASRVRPGPPVGIKAKLDANSVVLSWKAIPLEKIVGYEVYRRVDEGRFLKLTQVKEPIFVDKNVPKGLIEYAVTAVDMFANKSPLSKPVPKPSSEISR